MNSANIQQKIQTYLTGDKIPLFILCAWFAYLVLSPFYVFPKGRPQPADFILMLGMLPVMLSYILHKRIQIPPVHLIGGLFVLLTIFVNCINYIYFPDIRFLLTALIYPYNFLVFLFVIWMFRKDFDTAVKSTFYGLAVTIIIQLFVIMFFESGFRGYRGTAGFENPNQLAYWVLLTAAMIVFLRRNGKIRAVDWLLLSILTYMQALALSKAGIIAFSIFLLMLFFTPKISRMGYVVVLMGVIATIFYAIYDFDNLNRAFSNIEPLKNVIARIEGIGTEPDDSPEARGYYRIIEYPLYSLLGSGEGAFYRFNAEGYNRELHSGIATIIFSYGLFGALLFGSFIFLIIYRQPWYYVMLFVPIILFGLPHQSFRFAHFWVFLGINYGIFIKFYMEQQRQKRLEE